MFSYGLNVLLQEKVSVENVKKMRSIIQEVCKGHGEHLWGGASRDKCTLFHSFVSMRFGLGMLVILF